MFYLRQKSSKIFHKYLREYLITDDLWVCQGHEIYKNTTPREISVRFLKIFVLYTLLCSKWLSSYLAETTFITPAHRQVVRAENAWGTYSVLRVTYFSLRGIYGKMKTNTRKCLAKRGDTAWGIYNCYMLHVTLRCFLKTKYVTLEIIYYIY